MTHDFDIYIYIYIYINKKKNASEVDDRNINKKKIDPVMMI